MGRFKEIWAEEQERKAKKKEDIAFFIMLGIAACALGYFNYWVWFVKAP